MKNLELGKKELSYLENEIAGIITNLYLENDDTPYDDGDRAFLDFEIFFEDLIDDNYYVIIKGECHKEFFYSPKTYWEPADYEYRFGYVEISEIWVSNEDNDFQLPSDFIDKIEKQVNNQIA